MIGMVFTPLAGAVPIQPDNRFGIAYDSGVNPIVGEYVLGFIDGVQYGLSGATDGSGNFMIDVTGYDQDTPVPKSGGEDGDLIQYVWSPAMTGLTTPGTGTFFAETRGFVSASITNANLNEGATPALLKIDRVVTAGTWQDGNFFAIYNPTGAGVDLAAGTNWKFDVGAGPVDVLSVVHNGPISDVIAAGGYFYIDAPLANSDSIQLIDPNGWVMDRVEYGAIGTYPEETMMGNAPLPGGTMIYRQQAAGDDTNDCSVDFTSGAIIEPEPPSVLSTIPADTAIDVLPHEDIVIIFDETMNNALTPTLAQTTGTPVVYVFAGWSTTTFTDDTATWTHADWTWDEVVTMEVSLAQDVTGTPMVGTYSWSFTIITETWFFKQDQGWGHEGLTFDAPEVVGNPGPVLTVDCTGSEGPTMFGVINDFTLEETYTDAYDLSNPGNWEFDVYLWEDTTGGAGDITGSIWAEVKINGALYGLFELGRQM